MITTDIAIIGGGNIGLAVAHELSRHGYKVMVLEKNKIGKGATWASGGMLRPLTECTENKKMLSLALESHALYPRYVQKLEQESGVSLGYQTTGSLILAQSPEAWKKLQVWHRRVSAINNTPHLLSSVEIQHQEPLLAPQQGGLFMPLDHWLNSRKLVTALALAATKQGTLIKEEITVEKVITEQKGILLETTNGKIHTRKVVNCAGAWASLVTPELQIKPIKGHMLRLDAKGLSINHILCHDDLYIVPQVDGSLIIGSTTEDVAFDISIKKETIMQLRDHAVALVPRLNNCPVIEEWIGFRPHSPEGIPFLGRLRKNYFVATGHYRNGILLTPMTARLIAELIFEEDNKKFTPSYAYEGG